MQSTAPGVRRILVLCLGNHCRSPLAAAVIARRGAPAVDVRSAGLVSNHVGRPAHPLMISAAAELGYDLTGHRGVQAGPAQVAWADLILAMDASVVQQLQARVDESVKEKLRLYLDGADVPDPIHGSPADFYACAAIIEAGARPYLER